MGRRPSSNWSYRVRELVSVVTADHRQSSWAFLLMGARKDFVGHLSKMRLRRFYSRSFDSQIQHRVPFERISIDINGPLPITNSEIRCSLRSGEEFRITLVLRTVLFVGNGLDPNYPYVPAVRRQHSMIPSRMLLPRWYLVISLQDVDVQDYVSCFRAIPSTTPFILKSAGIATEWRRETIWRRSPPDSWKTMTGRWWKYISLNWPAGKVGTTEALHEMDPLTKKERI